MTMYPEQGTLALSDEERQERFAFQPMLPTNSLDVSGVELLPLQTERWLGSSCTAC